MDHDYQITRSQRTTISIEISPTGKILVKAPYLVPGFIIDNFVSSKSAWIKRKISDILKYSSLNNTGFNKKQKLLYLGKNLAVCYGNYQLIHKDEDNLYIPEIFKFRIKHELTNWYKHQARDIINKRIIYFSQVMNTSCSSTRFSDTISKWGTCTYDNHLQFSWRLVMAPMAVLDYVVVHELAHTIEKNHSQKFWKIVRKIKPAYKQYIKWLKANSHQLHSCF